MNIYSTDASTSSSLMMVLVIALYLSFTKGFMFTPKTRYTNHFHNSLLGSNTNRYSSHVSQTRKEGRRVTSNIVTNSILLSTLNSKNDDDRYDDDDDSSMPALPSGVIKYSQVPKQGKVFTATTIPSGLLKQHTTKKGTWGIINVSKGRLAYTIVNASSSNGEDGGDTTFELTPKIHGIIEPQRLHQVKPLTADVEFVVEFLRQPGTGPVNEKREGL